MDAHLSAELLEASHTFPGPYSLRVIGSTENSFVERVVARILETPLDPRDLTHSLRTTPGGRHVSIAIEINASSAEQILLIHERLRGLDGLVMML